MGCGLCGDEWNACPTYRDNNYFDGVLHAMCNEGDSIDTTLCSDPFFFRMLDELGFTFFGSHGCGCAHIPCLFHYVDIFFTAAGAMETLFLLPIGTAAARQSGLVCTYNELGNRYYCNWTCFLCVRYCCDSIQFWETPPIELRWNGCCPEPTGLASPPGRNPTPDGDMPLTRSQLEPWRDVGGKGRFAKVLVNFTSNRFESYTEYEILTDLEESRQSVSLIYYDDSGAKQDWPVLVRHLRLLDRSWRTQAGGPDYVPMDETNQTKENPIFNDDDDHEPAPAASATASDPYAVGSWVRLRKDETKAGMKEYTAYQITKSPDHEDDMWVDLKDPDTPKGTFVNKSKVTQTTGPDGEYYHTPFGVDTFVTLKRSDTDVYMEPRIPYIVRLNESDSEYIHVGKIDGSYAGIVEKHKLRPAFPKGSFVTLKVDESNTAMERHRCYPVVTAANGPNGDLKLDLDLAYPENDTVWCSSKKVKVAFEYGCKVKWAPGVEPHTANMFHNHEKLWEGDDVMQVWDDPDASQLGGGVGIDSSTTVKLMYKGEKFEAWVNDLVNTSLD